MAQLGQSCNMEDILSSLPISLYIHVLQYIPFTECAKNIHLISKIHKLQISNEIPNLVWMRFFLLEILQPDRLPVIKMMTQCNSCRGFGMSLTKPNGLCTHCNTPELIAKHAIPCGCGRCTECKLMKTSQNNNNMMVNDNNRDRGGLYDNIGEPTTIKLMKLFFDKSTSIIALKNVVNNNSNNNTEFHLTLPEMYKPFSNNLKSIFLHYIVQNDEEQN